jgi:hypothetical protein
MARTGELGQDRTVRTGQDRTEPPGEDWFKRITITGRVEQDNHYGPDSQDMKTRIGHPNRTGQSGQDDQDRVGLRYLLLPLPL